jgi:hypothetical protein
VASIACLAMVREFGVREPHHLWHGCRWYGQADPTARLAGRQTVKISICLLRGRQSGGIQGVCMEAEHVGRHSALILSPTWLAIFACSLPSPRQGCTCIQPVPFDLRELLVDI